MRIRSLAVHASQAVLEGALIAVLGVGLLAGTTFAAKGGGNPSNGSGAASLSLVMVADANGNGAPNWGDTVTFNVVQTATSYPTVSVTCYQGAVMVYGSNAGFYPSYPWPWARNFILSSPSWTSGSADCVASLYYSSGKKTITLATLPFAVAP